MDWITWFRSQIASDDDPEPQMGLLEHVAQRGYDVARLQHACRGIRQNGV
jgi:hypothetical protein